MVTSTTTVKKAAAAKPAAKKTATRKPAVKTPAKKATTRKAVDGGATTSTATSEGKKAGAGTQPAPAASSNGVVHWNRNSGEPNCGALSLGQPLHGHRERDKANCPACLPVPGSLVHPHPRVLLLHRNIRKGKLDPEFLASIAELGVLQPITAVVNDRGQLVVRFGERRALAAVEAKLTSVPVYVAGSDDLADAAEIDRIVRQHDENTHRDGLTATDNLHVVEQLVAFGVPASQIGKRARIPQAQVDAAVAVSGSKLAAAATAKYEALTLDQAAAVAEFEGETEIAQALIATAVDRPEQFPHVLQRQRDDRDEKRLIMESAAALEEKGVDVIAAPSYNDRATRVGELVDVETGKDITEAAHMKCPGNVAYVNVRRIGGDRKLTAVTVYCCNDPAKHGHRDRYSSGGGSGSRPKAADMSAVEREKAKKARRLVIDNNKAWRSAEPVRREWLAAFAKLKTPPKGAAAFIAEALARNARQLNENGTRELATELLGAKAQGSNSYHTSYDSNLLKGASENRALHVALVMVLASFEADLSDMSWRRDGKHSEAGRYLRFLESAGYPLSDVEKFAVSSKTAS